MTFHRYVALGDSFTEGVGDPDDTRPNGLRGWADRIDDVPVSGPAPSLPVLARHQQLAENVRWTREFLVPWVHRRVPGRSSGDLVSPKRPDLGPVG